MIPNHILWAVDAFGSSSSEETKALASVLPNLGQHCTIEPIFVLLKNEVRGGPERAEKALFDLMERLAWPGVVSPRVLYAAGGSPRDAVLALNEYATRINPMLILVGTKGLSGVKRLAIGSFAESLVQESIAPVWVFNPASRADVVRRVLYATDLSESSRRTYLELDPILGLMQAEVIVYHHIETPRPLELPAGRDAGAYELSGADSDQTRWQTEVDDFAHSIRLSGTRIRSLVDSYSEGTGPAVVAAAKRADAGIIALAAQSGRMAAALGSVSSYVMRHAECSVLVLHDRNRAKRQAVA